ncbi:5-dehydro-4-deoxy-D-glucuronate isomerase [Parasphaerochaeta coccoides]|uniref:4-deoxy-L-threo-5-hexosulose-uronate ketol-isomerase n=1 Tax=Parasphaerochaeta coccoides (strain ATCC BAA-1237 / DSM 17374 / SPN1) TaxID=760011 RepID=F4GM01_PARC1|nr:5-dehydro-4-deoxy-D-glucuronate isomerase [Parasphaerochaeta coccoides]AEC03042.1 4-deoxy-L-threo-5-hexulose uronate isomerase [Parasphaerochaeta coccoides DSM 17374]
MDIRYSTGKEPFARMNTAELRKEFLITDIFRDNDVTAVYSHIDRIVTMGAKPVKESLRLDKNIDTWKNFGVTYFLERRELGIINIGGEGTVHVDGTGYVLPTISALYVPMGTKEVSFTSKDAAKPAKFYMCSTPAHREFPLTFIPRENAKQIHLGASETSNERTINQFIHPDVLDTCQLSMGVTFLATGSVWNTMPAHTHERRMEVYFYFDIPKDNVVFHFFGEPTETRHIIMHNEQAVLNPSWSIHSGGGTSNYSFIWAMAGENRAYADQDFIDTLDLR